MKRSTKTHILPAFTLVELLIVIVVIAVLATLALMAYNGIQTRAHASAAQSDLASAKKQLMLAQVDTGSFPTTTASLSANGGTTYELSTNTTASPQTFCLTGTNGTISYKVTESSAPVQGSCPGHGSGGVAAITNLSQNPVGIGATGWFSKMDATATDTANVSWGGRDTWHRFVKGTNNGNFRMLMSLSDLTSGQIYTSSVLVANPGTASFSAEIDFCDQGVVAFTLAPGETKRVSSTASRSTYDNTYRFLDVGLSSSNAEGLLVTEVMITKGSTVYTFADGDSPNWIWNGTQNSSTSTGPVL